MLVSKRHVVLLVIEQLLLCTISVSGMAAEKIDFSSPQREAKCYEKLKWKADATTVDGNITEGTAPQKLSGPRGLFFHQKSQSLYIADRDNHRVQQLLSDGRVKTVAGDPNGNAGASDNRLNQPSALYVDDNENLFIADTKNHRVLKWTKDATSGDVVAGQTGSPGPSIDQLDNPQAIWVDSRGDLYIADLRNHRIIKRTSESASVVAGGNGEGDLPNQLNSPVGLYFDEANSALYISNYFGHSITKWRIGDSTGTFIAGSAGHNGSSSTQFCSPSTVALDNEGNMYVADTKNHRIQLFCNDSLGDGKTIAGITGQSGHSSNRLNFPHDFALNTEHLALFVADSDNNRIQRFDFLASPSSADTITMRWKTWTPAIMTLILISKFSLPNHT